MQANNDNRTVLYRIRRKSDGRFLNTKPTRSPGRQPNWIWSKNGAFWRTEGTIREHLLALCYSWYYEVDDSTKVTFFKNNSVQIYQHGMPVKQVGPYYERLNLYEVVAIQVTEHESDIMEARTFASFSNDLRKQA